MNSSAIENFQNHLNAASAELVRINSKNALSGGTIRALDRALSSVDCARLLLPAAHKVEIKEAKLALSYVMNHISSVLDVLRSDNAQPVMVRQMKVASLEKIDHLANTLPEFLLEQEANKRQQVDVDLSSVSFDSILTKAGEIIRKNKRFVAQLPKPVDLVTKPFTVMRLPIIPIFSHMVNAKALSDGGMEVEEIPTNVNVSYVVLHGQLVLAINKRLMEDRGANSAAQSGVEIEKWQDDLANGSCYRACRDYLLPLVEDKVEVETKKWKTLLHDGRHAQSVEVVNQRARIKSVSELHYKLRGMKKLTGDELRIVGPLLRTSHRRTSNSVVDSDDYTDTIVRILEKKTGKGFTIMGNMNYHPKARGWLLYWLVPNQELGLLTKFGALEDWGLAF